MSLDSREEEVNGEIEERVREEKAEAAKAKERYQRKEAQAKESWECAEEMKVLYDRGDMRYREWKKECEQEKAEYEQKKAEYEAKSRDVKAAVMEEEHAGWREFYGKKCCSCYIVIVLVLVSKFLFSAVKPLSRQASELSQAFISNP